MPTPILDTSSNRQLKWVLIYLFLYILIYIVVFVLWTYFSDNFIFILSFLSSFSFSNKFLILFLLQEILLIVLLLVSLVYINGKNWFPNLYYYFKNKFSWLWFRKILKYVLGMFFVYIFLNYGLISFLKFFNFSIPWLYWEQSVAVFLENWSWKTYYDYIVLIICVSIIWPFVEEIIYRGFITQIFLDRFWSKIWVFVSSFIFAFVHFEWNVFLNLFILSFILSFIYLRTKSLTYCFFFHFLINFLWVLAIIFAK